ncbi:MAG: hypothetical protein CVU11_16245 [Bacteroidetes bacterium HGW-Bacteroidetes-6]|jgi:hypothetical protein|nr:MAG: hypothetical protein CVU11_16245 [Bacteroidetes bacterium HGW-Bacteroidetes-6]
MLKALFVFAVLIPFFLFGQKTIEKDLKKLGIEKSDMVFSNESILFYPRGFIYCLSEPDSVYYLGCLSTDRKSVKAYFEGEIIGKTPVTNIILRGCQDLTDTIYLESLHEKIEHFTSIKRDNLIHEATKYVIVYYWCSEMLDRKYVKNIRFLRKYAAANPERGIQVIFVSTDKY